MFLTDLVLNEVFAGVWETGAPLVFNPATEAAPPAITVPAGFRVKFEFVPPPARRWVLPVGGATAPAVIYAWMRAEGVPRGLAMAVFQEALRAVGVPFHRRLMLRLCL